MEEFIQFAEHNVVSCKNGIRIRCPCVNCLNGRILSVSEIKEHLIILVLTLDIICYVGEEVQAHKHSLGCTLRYLKYICSLNLMCLTHSFNTFIFTCSPTDNLEIMSAVTMLCNGC